MLKIFVCDDNQEMIKRYSQLIKKVAKKNNITIKISTFSSGELLLSRLLFIRENPDIIYLDILMKSVNGIETAKKLREMDVQAEIIFLTTSEDYVYEAFDVKPIQYLMKQELSVDKFEQTFLNAVEAARKKIGEQFVIQSGKSVLRVPIDSIRYFEVFRRMVTVYYDDKSFQYYATLKELEIQLKEIHFIRIHRSYIVNMQYIIDFQKEGVYLRDGNSLPVGITYYDSAKEAFMDYIYQTSTQIFERGAN